VPKSDEHQYYSKNVATPRATNFTLSTGVHTKFVVTELYTQADAMGPLFVTVELAIDQYGFSNHPSIGSEEV